MIQTKARSGFTIVELLIVIAVIGILAALVVTSFAGVRERARSAAAKSDVSQVAKRLAAARAESGTYPDTIDGLVTADGTPLIYHRDSGSTDYCLESQNDGQVYSSSSSNPQPSPVPCAENGLLGWWRLDGDAADATAQGAHGTIYGNVTPAANRDGQSGSAMYFDGSSGSYIRLPATIAQSIMTPATYGESWTLSIWGKWDSVYVNEGILLGRVGCNGGIYEYQNKFAFAIKGAGCWTGSQTIHGSAMDTAWHLFTATYQAGRMVFYQDGVLQGTAYLEAMHPYGGSFGIGSGGSAAYNFHGALDDARIYTRSLSLEEVVGLYGDGPQ